MPRQRRNAAQNREINFDPPNADDDQADRREPVQSPSSRVHVPIPKSLNLHSGNIAENWRKFIKSYEFYEIASGLDEKPDKVRVAALLSIIGDAATDLFSTFEWSRADQKWKWLPVLQKFREYCEPRKSVMFETYKFGMRKQDPSESVDGYVTGLRQLAETCAFTDKERRIRDQLVVGLRDPKARERLLREEDPSLADSLQIVRAIEIAEMQSTAIEKPEEPDEISKLDHSKKSQSHQPDRAAGQKQPYVRRPGGPRNQGQQNVQSQTKRRCKFCNYEHVFGQKQCPAFGKKCNGCGMDNHFERCCPNEEKVQETQEINEVISIFALRPDKRNKKTLTVDVVGSSEKVTFVIDTGAPINTLPVRDYIRVTGDKMKKNLTPSSETLTAYGGSPVKVYGHCQIRVKLRDGRKFELHCTVVDVIGAPLLSLPTSENMGVVQVKHSDQDAALHVTSTSATDITSQYDDVFTGLGKLDGKYEIKLDDNVKPVIHAPRPVPVSLRDSLKSKLDELEKMGVIAKVTEPTNWVSSMLIKKEDTKLRICLDPQDLNRAIRREHYPLPTVEDVATRLSKAKVFSLVDAKSGFWHIELEEASSYLTTFNTPFGRYRWLRMPFGICSASEVWQRRMHEFAEGLIGVEVIADDFLIYRCGDTKEEADIDHDKNLKALLQRSREQNLRLNPDKKRIKMTQLPYIGHILTPEGIKMDPRKLDAILKMPKPTNVAAVQRFLGMVQYLSKFLPNLSTIAEPLRRLTDKDSIWTWDSIHDEAIEKLKSLVSAAPVLAYYDVTKPLSIECDASQNGLGATLLQEGKPVTFASRALTDTEQRYAQIEKELLAIVFACTRFDQYVYGRDVVVHSDHKPLETIFRKPIWKSPKRLQRMLMILQRYQLTVVYKRGTEMYIADALSRAFLTTNTDSPLDLLEMELSKSFETTSLTEDSPNSSRGFEEIRAATKLDSDLKDVLKFVVTGWPEQRNMIKASLLPYFTIREELAIDNGLLFKGDRVVIPKTLRMKMMQNLHSSHVGIEACLRLGRQHIYWPCMNNELKQFISKCEICNKFQPEQTQEPMMSHQVPTRPWEFVSTDLFQLKGTTYLIVVDHYSNYFEYARLASETSATVIYHLKKIFSSHGIPDKVMSDNGRQYSSAEFKAFADSWNFTHVTSSPGYAQSNGRAESAVKICKTMMLKSLEAKTDFFQALLDWRNTPSSTTGLSPAQCLFSRRTRTTLPILSSKLKPEMQTGVTEKICHNRKLQKTHYDKRAKPLPQLKENDPIRMKPPGKDTWEKGVVVKVFANRQYLIEVNGTLYRRNRRFLRKVLEDPPVILMKSKTQHQSSEVRRSPRLLQRN